MMRRLQALDRLDERGSTAQRRRARPATSFARPVGAFIAAGSLVAIFAASLMFEFGYVVDRTGFHKRASLGTPPTVPTGIGSHRFIAHQPFDPTRPVTYDPCRVMEIVINDALAPRGADGIVERALSEISTATGLRMDIVGLTDEPASQRRPPRDVTRYGRGWSPVIIGWTEPTEIRRLAGDVAGVGGSTRVDVSGRGTEHYVTGAVWLDAPQLARVLQRPDGVQQTTAIVLHELGHLVGLAHVDDSGELMAKENAGRTTLGPGDREGLADLGRGRCR